MNGESRDIKAHTTHYNGCGCMIELTYAEYSQLTEKCKRYEDALDELYGTLVCVEDIFRQTNNDYLAHSGSKWRAAYSAALNPEKD